jgi:hypothetical protein
LNGCYLGIAPQGKGRGENQLQLLSRSALSDKMGWVVVILPITLSFPTLVEGGL